MRLTDFWPLATIVALMCACEPSKELLSRTYSESQIEALCTVRPNQCAEVGSRFYLIDEGFIFHYDFAIQSKQYVPHRINFSAREIVNYQDQLVALSTNDNIYLLTTKADWIRVGFNTVQLASNHDHLAALTEDQQVWVASGELHKPRASFGTETAMVPMGNGEPIPVTNYIPINDLAFEKIATPMPVQAITVEEGEIVVLLENGDRQALQF